ncbi:hypothetical protein I3760_11G049100 [Carya illinoinensis]|uniref:Uncharacterized protein n=1 Tax=Carya illinoinensis TaxID=32201 RepID=A0A8T1NVD3_CARIL|nr:hypothetical protein I3760_11G049100 [Carya illinoinensis]KAG6635559.1 hypothetical protein CIPAW_11G050900 [Carya illinoinensis]KAG6687005.1 hypothetical protein I3842_11G049400 [Carya illinoinensis]
MEILVEKQQAMTPPTHANFQTLNTIKRLNPGHQDNNTLYDSFELRAMTHQLNKAIQGSNVSSPPYMFHLKSHFCRKNLARIYKKGAKSSQLISYSPSTHARTRTMSNGAGTIGGFVSRWWKKIKRGFLRN